MAATISATIASGGTADSLSGDILALPEFIINKNREDNTRASAGTLIKILNSGFLVSLEL